MPDGWIFAMMVARDGTLWLSTMDKVAVPAAWRAAVRADRMLDCQGRRSLA
jgi:hypothetical protein